MKPLHLCAVMLAGWLLCGCSMVTRMTTAKATFAVSVKNETTEPIRVGLTKDGPPREDGWTSPDEFAILNVRRPDAVWGQAVLPGQTATLGPIDGRFSDGVHGFLRVYAGDASMADMLAIARRSPSRLDLPLAEGSNRFVINDDNGRLAFKRLPPDPSMMATAKK